MDFSYSREPAGLPMKILALFLFLFLAGSTAFSLEFDYADFPKAGEHEKAFREAVSLGAQSPAEALYRLNSMDTGDIPIDAVLWAKASLSSPADAKRLLEEIHSLGASSPFYEPALEKLAALAVEEGNAPLSASLLEKLLEKQSSDDRKAATLGKLLALYEKLADREKALKTAETLFVSYAARPEAEEAATFLFLDSGDEWGNLGDEQLYKRGKTLLDGGSREKAVLTLKALAKRQKALQPKVGLALGKALHYLRRYEESLEPLSQAAKSSSDPETVQSATFWRARSLFGLDRGNEGAPLLVKLAKRYSDDKEAPAWLYQAYRVFEGRKMEEEAKSARNALMTGYPGSEEAVEVLLSDGLAAFRQGRYPAAAASFKEAISKAGRGFQEAQALYWSHRAAKAAGDREGAAKAADRLFSQYPVGYYTKALQGESESPAGGGWLGEARVRGGLKVDYPPPLTTDLPATGPYARAAAYVRIGMPEAARRLLRGEDAPPWLLYFAEDFNGALKAAKGTWFDWSLSPGKKGGAVSRLYYPVAYPASVAAASAESGVHPSLILAIAHTESHFEADAYSPWEARGLMQFIPATAARTAKALGMGGFRDEDLYDPRTALRLGAKHLAELLEKFDGNVVSAVAAYNAGEAAVERWREKSPGIDEPDFVERIPYRETRRYVKKVLTAVDAYDQLQRYRGLWNANRGREE